MRASAMSTSALNAASLRSSYGSERKYYFVSPGGDGEHGRRRVPGQVPLDAWSDAVPWLR
jgi:hypothetical protein